MKYRKPNNEITINNYDMYVYMFYAYVQQQSTVINAHIWIQVYIVYGITYVSNSIYVCLTKETHSN